MSRTCTAPVLLNEAPSPPPAPLYSGTPGALTCAPPLAAEESEGDLDALPFVLDADPLPHCTLAPHGDEDPGREGPSGAGRPYSATTALYMTAGEAA